MFLSKKIALLSFFAVVSTSFIFGSEGLTSDFSNMILSLHDAPDSDDNSPSTVQELNRDLLQTLMSYDILSAKTVSFLSFFTNAPRSSIFTCEDKTPCLSDSPSKVKELSFKQLQDLMDCEAVSAQVLEFISENGKIIKDEPFNPTIVSQEVDNVLLAMHNKNWVIYKNALDTLEWNASLFPQFKKYARIKELYRSTTGATFLHIILSKNIQFTDQKMETIKNKRENLIIKDLLKTPGLVNTKTENGTTPIHIAIENNNFQTATLLIEAGADVNAENNEGKTPMHYAATIGNLEAMKLLIKAKALVNAKSKDGITPMHLAAQNGKLEAIILLIETEGDVHAKSKDGITPMHCAASKSDNKIIKALYRAGADVRARDKDNNTPMHYAIKTNSEYTPLIIETLVTCGADVNAKNSENYVHPHKPIQFTGATPYKQYKYLNVYKTHYYKIIEETLIKLGGKE